MSVRRYGVMRTVLITYGIAAYSVLRPRGSVPESGFAPSTLLLGGVAVQLLLTGARWLIRRNAPDPDVATRAMDVVDLLGDGVTVLLFALGTLGTILSAAGNA